MNKCRRAGDRGTPGSTARAWAARAVAGVLDERRSLDAALAAVPDDLAAADRALVAALAYGVLRELRILDAALAPRVKRTPQPLLAALLRVGVYQLDYMRVPAHAGVHATVAATRELGLSRARGLVNAVLRGHLREPPAAPTAAAVRVSHPDWLVAAIERDWPAQAAAILAANNRPAPMHLRVNARCMPRDTYVARLADAGVDAAPHPSVASAVTLAEPSATRDLPGFAAGRVSVQDAAAQLAAPLVAAAPGQRVLDACAAPGNKTAHLLEGADIDLLALDIDAARLATLEANLARLGLCAECRVADTLDVARWWDGRPFDRILLDAPCSGTGVIRRHPDIKWLRRESDIAAAAARQRALLAALWPTLAPGGRLVYATCSLLRAEGADVVAAFLASQEDAREARIDGDWGAPDHVGRRIASGAHGGDGFYYALLERVATH